MKSTVAAIAALSVAGGIAGFGTSATSAEEIETPYEEKLDQQDAQAQGRTQQQVGQQTDGQTQLPEGQTQQAEQQQDDLVAEVDGQEIRRSDVIEAIETLPPQVQETPPQMLFPAVLDQLITRRLIVEEARAEGLQDDPEVQELVAQGAGATEDQALTEVWLRREIGERVTEADVQKGIEELKAANPQMEETAELAPQVKQALQVQAMTDISDELRQSAEVTFYGPGGEPVDTAGQAQVGGGAEMEAEPQATGDQGAATEGGDQQN